LLRFEDAEKGETVVEDALRDGTYDDGCDLSKIGLDQFFDRWVQIHQINWNEGSTLYDVFNPWTDYLVHPTIYSKLRGYSRLHCRIQLKFVVNGSPFQFGILMGSYRPLSSSSKNVITEGVTQYHYGGGNLDSTYMQACQSGAMARSCRPHVYLYPQNNLGAEMTLPMMQYGSWIYPISYTPDTTGPTAPYPFLDEMGEFTLESLAALQVAGTATGLPVVITVFARAIDMELSGASMVVQSSMHAVSDAADTVNKVSGGLQDVPLIGPYMRPIEIASKYTGDVAKFLGLHTLPVRDTPALRQHTIPGLANPGVCAHMDKLTLDPDNQLTLDSRTVGLDGSDDMSISHIVKRQTYLTSTTWSCSSSAGTSLFCIYAIPDLWYSTTKLGKSGSHSYTAMTAPPMGYVASAFQFWRGSLKFTFRVVAPLMNRGRLKITFDPAFYAGTGYAEGVLHTEIIDLSKDSEVTIVAPYMSFLPWLYTNTSQYLNGASVPWAANTAGLGGLSNGQAGCNGLIQVSVLNHLVGPDITQAAQVHVFVEPGEDFELAGPQSIPIAVRGGNTVETSLSDLYTVQSSMQLLDDKRETTKAITTKYAPSRALHAVCMGEKVESVRALCRRFFPSFPITWNPGAADGAVLVTMGFGRFPPFRGTSGGTTYASRNACVTVDTNGTGYNFVPHTFLHWFTACYVGWRGSINWKVVQLPGAASIQPMQMTLSRGQLKAQPAIAVIAAKSFSTLASLQLTKPSGMDGMTASDGVIQPCTDAAFPMYQNYRMMPCNPIYNTPYGISDPYANDRYGQDTDVVLVAGDGTISATTSSYDYNVRTYAAAGDDFSLFFFLNPPTLYVASSSSVSPSTTN